MMYYFTFEITFKMLILKMLLVIDIEKLLNRTFRYLWKNAWDIFFLLFTNMNFVLIKIETSKI